MSPVSFSIIHIMISRGAFWESISIPNMQPTVSVVLGYQPEEKIIIKKYLHILFSFALSHLASLVPCIVLHLHKNDHLSVVKPFPRDLWGKKRKNSGIVIVIPAHGKHTVRLLGSSFCPDSPLPPRPLVFVSLWSDSVLTCEPH